MDDGVVRVQGLDVGGLTSDMSDQSDTSDMSDKPACLRYNGVCDGMYNDELILTSRAYNCRV